MAPAVAELDHSSNKVAEASEGSDRMRTTLWPSPLAMTTCIALHEPGARAFPVGLRETVTSAGIPRLFAAPSS